MPDNVECYSRVSTATAITARSSSSQADADATRLQSNVLLFGIQQVLNETTLELNQRIDHSAAHTEHLEELIVRSDRIMADVVEQGPTSNETILNLSHKPEDDTAELGTSRTTIEHVTRNTMTRYGNEQQRLASGNPTSAHARQQTTALGHQSSIESLGQYPIASHDIVSFETISLRRCPSLCKCQCHSWTSIRSYTFLERISGRFFLNYNALPIFSPRTCNSPHCQTNQRNSIRFTFFLPKWILNRAIEISVSWGSMTGLGADLHISFPRVIRDGDIAWHYISNNNMAGICRMISNGEIFPTDIGNTYGDSLALVSLMTTNTRDIVQNIGF
jgi:hypothetical protein